MTSVALTQAPAPKLWRVAQFVGLALTVGMIVALFMRPAPALHLLWDVVIPVLPATFLISPMLWRNVCPLATLNTIAGTRGGWRSLSAGENRTAWIVGIALLALMVPARRFLFNTNGEALAITVAVVAALALGLGLVFTRRSGFCDSLCPVLPVEKLYGQSQLLHLGSVRCPDCTLCVPAGCVDLAQTKSAAQTLGPARRENGWLTLPFGIFAAAFPGFIVGYFTVDNGGLASAAPVYAHIELCAAASYALVYAAVLVFRIPSHRILRVLGAMAALLYYWYAAPKIGEAYLMPGMGPPLVRALAATLVVFWMWPPRRRITSIVR